MTTELLTIAEVAQHLRVDDTTVRRWIKTGILQAVALPHAGRRTGYRVNRSMLDEILSGSMLDKAAKKGTGDAIR